jgi:hypothetical protein
MGCVVCLFVIVTTVNKLFLSLRIIEHCKVLYITVVGREYCKYNQKDTRLRRQ